MDMMGKPAEGGMMDAQAPEGEGAPKQSGGATELVSQIHTMMLKLMELEQSSGSAEQDDLAALDSAISAFEAAVNGLGGKSGGEKPMPASSSPEAGGNPNARPF